MAKIKQMRLPLKEKKKKIDVLRRRMERFGIAKCYMPCVKLVRPQTNEQQVKHLMNSKSEYFNFEIYAMMMDIFNPNKVEIPCQ